MPAASTSASSESSSDEPADYDPFAPWQAANGLPGMGTPSVEISDPFGIEWGQQQQQQQHDNGNGHHPPSHHQLPPPPQPQFRLPDVNGSETTYSMTPMDMLCSVFAGTDITPNEVEQALGHNGWDIDRAMEALVNRPPPDPAAVGFQLNGGALSPSLNRHGALGAPPIRPIPMSRDSFNRLAAPMPSPRHESAPNSPRWGSRPVTPGASPNPASYPASAATNRVCRYYVRLACHTAMRESSTSRTAAGQLPALRLSLQPRHIECVTQS
jgi:hypothetical protein